MIFSNLPVPTLFDLCRDPSFNSLICSKAYFWDYYYFHRLNKRFKSSKEFSTSKDFFIKVNDEYQSNMKNEYYNDGLCNMAFYGLKEELNLLI